MISLFSNLITLLRLLFKLIRYNIISPMGFFKITFISKLALKFFYDRSFDNHNWGERLVYWIALGPIFIKFWALATRADIIGRDNALALTQLQDNSLHSVRAGRTYYKQGLTVASKIYFHTLKATYSCSINRSGSLCSLLMVQTLLKNIAQISKNYLNET